MKDYWREFWLRHGEEHQDAEPQQQVLRTLNRQSIEPALWARTQDYVLSQLELGPDDMVLDFCGGNGLFAHSIARKVRSVILTDLSASLLDAGAGRSRPDNVRTVVGDMCTLEFEESSFDRILWYAALQYLSPIEAVAVFRKVSGWLKPGGVLFCGDIPDARRQWDFFDTAERRAICFERLSDGTPIVGTWFDAGWLKALSEVSGFQQVEILPQPEEQIYSWFRFDLKCIR